MAPISEGLRDTLLILMVPGAYLLFVMLGRWLKRRHGVRLGVLYHFFAASLAVYVPAVALGMPWSFLRHLGAAIVILAAGFLIALVDRFVWDLYFLKHHGVKVPRFLVEVAGLAIVTIAAFLVLDYGYNQSLKGLLIAPGIAAVIIGLAMQDLLGNIIAGIALQVGKSFVEGDWLLIDGRYAEVVEINWRATRLRTNDDFSIEVPNRTIAQQTIVNLNRPQRRHAMRVPIVLDYAAPPTRVKEVLLHAAVNVAGVASEPKPRVYLKQFGDSGIEYEIQFWLDDFETFNEVSDAIRTHLWYGLRRHGIRIPFPTRTLLLEKAARDVPQDLQRAARQFLRQHAFFESLADEELDALLPRGRVAHFGSGENIICQGANGASMFILVVGEADVLVEQDHQPKRVGSIKAGDCFGEMSLLTGEARRATVRARTDCEAVEIGKEVLARSLKEHPDLLARLSELLARRQMENEGILARGTGAGANDQQAVYAAGFVEKLKGIFKL